MIRKHGMTVDGSMTYLQYIHSPAWVEKKAAFKRSGLFKGKCDACGSSVEIHLHHKTYKRLGAEYLHDLVELCGTCHFSGHEQGFANWKMPKLLRKTARKQSRLVKRQERINKFNAVNAALQAGTLLRLTHQMLHNVASQIGGWNKTQLFLLGVQWPPRRGWLKKLVGKEIASDVWKQVVEAMQ